jgi:hypothetical protein
VLFIAYIALVFFSLTATLLEINERWSIPVLEAYKRALPYFWKIFFVAILSTLAMLGGAFLFIIPAIFVSLWLLFAQVAVVFDNKTGMSALLYSKQLTTGRLGKLFWYFAVLMLVVMLISFTIGMIPVVNIFISLFTTPFTLIFTARLYKVFQRTAPTEVAPISGSGMLKAFIALGIVGIVVIAVVAVFAAIFLNGMTFR